MSDYFNSNLQSYHKYKSNMPLNNKPQQVPKQYNTTPLYSDDLEKYDQANLSMSTSTNSFLRIKNNTTQTKIRSTDNVSPKTARKSSATKHKVSYLPSVSPYKVRSVVNKSSYSRNSKNQSNQILTRSETPNIGFLKATKLTTSTRSLPSPFRNNKPRRTVSISNIKVDRYETNYDHLPIEKSQTTHVSNQTKRNNSTANSQVQSLNTKTNKKPKLKSNHLNMFGETPIRHTQTQTKQNLTVESKKKMKNSNLDKNNSKYTRSLTPQSSSSNTYSYSTKSNILSNYEMPSSKSYRKLNLDKPPKIIFQNRSYQTLHKIGSDQMSFNSNSKTIICSERGVQTRVSSYPWIGQFEYINISPNVSTTNKQNSRSDNPYPSGNSTATKKEKPSKIYQPSPRRSINTNNSFSNSNSHYNSNSNSHSYSSANQSLKVKSIDNYSNTEKKSDQKKIKSNYRQVVTNDFLTRSWFGDEIEDMEPTRSTQNKYKYHLKNAKNEKQNQDHNISQNNNSSKYHERQSRNRKYINNRRSNSQKKKTNNRTKSNQTHRKKRNNSSESKKSTTFSNLSSLSSRSSHSSRKGRSKVNYPNRNKSRSSRNQKYSSRNDQIKIRESEFENFKKKYFNFEEEIKDEDNNGRRDPLSKILTLGNFDSVKNDEYNHYKKEYRDEYNKKKKKYNKRSRSSIRKPRVQTLSHNSQDYSHNRWLGFSMKGPDPNKKTEITSSYSGSAFSEISSYRSTDEDKKYW
ncbi:hypothetical protein M0812_24421 [Anaeramoeba flamelloides]|uniref:Uncharacterized protein n=1 Tax=Anaeramoeba flamelloides TaxID=1746091 RepID=A0AAV7YKB9_9EUKA|nr:hypothetical protein M0812_24421 [Anaeramoeba flamelloides]